MSTIVEAVGVSANSSPVGARDNGLSQRIEAAMSAAVLECAAKGITAPDQVRAAMMAARSATKATARAEKIGSESG